MINVVCTQYLCYYLFGLILPRSNKFDSHEYAKREHKEKAKWKIECIVSNEILTKNFIFKSGFSNFDLIRSVTKKKSNKYFGTSNYFIF